MRIEIERLFITQGLDTNCSLTHYVKLPLVIPSERAFSLPLCAFQHLYGFGPAEDGFQDPINLLV